MKNSLAQYIKAQSELYGREAIICDEGFAVYKAFEDNSVYVHLIYIDLEHRNKGIASRLMKNLIKHTNAKNVYSYVDTTTNNTEDSILAHLLFGFKVVSLNATSINFMYEVTNQTNKEREE